MLGTALALVFSSCSVKEDRSDCPCMLVLDIGEAGRDSLFFAVQDEPSEFRFSDTLSGSVFRVPLPRRRVDCCFVWGGDCSPSGVEIPFGEQCPPLWMDACSLVPEGERVDYEVVLHKSYCRMTIDLSSADEALSLMPSVRIYGNVCGYSFGGVPLAGPFSFDAAGRVCTVLLPRQMDSSLMMDISSGGVLRTFALGELLEADGYDWSAPDLDDVSLFVDYAVTTLTLRIQDYLPEAPQEVVV